MARFLTGTRSPDIGDVEVIGETVVPHIRCQGFPGFPNGAFSGRESYKSFFRIFRQSFSDMAFETTGMIATEDFVSAHWEIWATQHGELQGIAPDGRASPSTASRSTGWKTAGSPKSGFISTNPCRLRG